MNIFSIIFSKYLLIFFAIGLVLSSCKDDDEPQNDDTLIHFDGNNFNAPDLPVDKYEAAVRFTSDILEEHNGKQLVAAQVYLKNVPAQTIVKVYGPGNEAAPGDLITSKNVSGDVGTDRWNTITFDSPVDINEEDLWITVLVDHPETFGSVGCDPGPAESSGNGDIMFVLSDNVWTNLREFTNGETDINWNIRGVVE